MSFLTISNENKFFKIQGTRLGAIVAPNKDLVLLLRPWLLSIFVQFSGEWIILLGGIPKYSKEFYMIT